MGGDGGGEVEQASTLRKSQEKLLDVASDFLRKGVGKGATALPFDAVADPSDLFERAFADFRKTFDDPEASGRITQGLQDILSGKGVFQSDIGRVSREFTEQITNPMTQSLRETMGVDVQNELNQPGRLFASDVQEKVGEAITRQLGMTTAPLLANAIEQERTRGFASSEANMARQLPTLSALQQLPMMQTMQAFQVAGAEQGFRQQVLDRQKAEFLRMAPEFNPYISQALGFATANTMENIVQQGSDPMGGLLGAGMGMAGSFMGTEAGAGALAGIFGGAGGASAGGLMAGGAAAGGSAASLGAMATLAAGV